ncbi:2-keto-4-pentenoate hydratase [Salinihabitans flavidus]|uniref:2-keto-4-pentenoate hydratase n=2 Tax=Salinihabitans flavidus TaxID=569882 RepID=A0A1H8MMG1_9RHOB|nr:2-keto-4-pentenoate hydratase [Salinihabitans flavidus]
MTETETVTRIVQDIRGGAPFSARETDPPRDLKDAYKTQDSVAEILTQDGAFGPVAGWKIAANSTALLDRFGLGEPASGRVFTAQRHDSPAMLRAADYRQFALEPEIAAVMGTTLAPQDAPFGTQTVLAAIDRFIPAIELLDMRETDMGRIHLPDVIAQNISNVGAVLGGPGTAPETLKPDTVRTTLAIDGEIRHDVTGAAPQDPLKAVTWLANHLGERGLTLQAGQVVLCGTHSPIWYHDGTGEIVLEMSGLGSATLRLD